jgi:L-ascorbate metabolism protein UlaG (beta-lactamase superfamily)
MHMRIRFIIAVVFALAAVPAAAADRVPAEGGDILITPLIHSSVLIEHAGKVIYIDPWSRGDLSGAKPADLILVTDDVGHHLDVKAIAALQKPGTQVVLTKNAQARFPSGTTLQNGVTTTAAGVRIESIAAYDIKPGAPEHPKGEANGYIIELGGKRLYFAGVTECVPEVETLKNIEVAFMPMNVPVERMTPSAAAECVKKISPKIVYIYHYDQDFATRAGNPNARLQEGVGRDLPELGLPLFEAALKGTGIEFRRGAWYPSR